MATKKNWSPPENYEKKYFVYTPLTSIEHIFEVNKGKGIFRRPISLMPWQSKDKKKYCDYHEFTDHNAYECSQLKDEIEDLVKRDIWQSG